MTLTQEFKRDLAEGTQAELLALEVLSNQTTLYNFEWVGDQREYRYKGDIIATDKDGNKTFIEIKNDKDIYKTGNVLCEDENYIKDDGRFLKGNMYNDTDVFVVVS